jgi:hypothetical protein
MTRRSPSNIFSLTISEICRVAILSANLFQLLAGRLYSLQITPEFKGVFLW